MIERAEELVTVFGGGGFIGRYVCECLLNSGVRVRVAQRDPRQAYFIQPLAQVGQFGFVRADITNADSVRDARQGRHRRRSTCAACSAGTMHGGPCRRRAQRRRGRARGRRWRAGPCLRDRRRPRLAIQLRPHQGRGRGRRSARRSPSATIIRPSLVFGPEDNLTNRFAGNGAAAVPPGDRRQAQFPAGLCPRPGAGDRQGRARSADAMAARPMRSAARR